MAIIGYKYSSLSGTAVIARYRARAKVLPAGGSAGGYVPFPSERIDEMFHILLEKRVDDTQRILVGSRIEVKRTA
jgi:hypothetical protein